MPINRRDYKSEADWRWREKEILTESAKETENKIIDN